MRKAVIALAALSAMSAVLAGPASAARAHVFGKDAKIHIAGTSIYCGGDVEQGVTLMVCYRAQANGNLIPGSGAFAVGQNAVAVEKVVGQTPKVLLVKHQPHAASLGGAHPSNAVTVLHVGDKGFLAGTDVAIVVLRDTNGKVTVEVLAADQSGNLGSPVTGSYLVSLSDKDMYLMQAGKSGAYRIVYHRKG